MRILVGIAALCVAFGAYLIVIIDRRHEEIKDSRRASRRTVTGAKVIGLAGLLILAWSLAAYARPSPYPSVTQFNGDRYSAQAQMGADVVRAVKAKRAARSEGRRRARKGAGVPLRRQPIPVASEAYRADARLSLGGGIRREAARVIGGRPAGCPSRFCGCGASLHLFGRIIPSLNLAANWLRFPRAEPAPRMVAARRGHVFVLERHIAGLVWMVHDSNSGGRRTRIHARSIAGFQIVNPHRSG